MATAFRATSRGYRADLDAHERRLLSSLCADVIELLQSRTAEVSEAAGEGAESTASASATGSEDTVPGTLEDSVLAHFSAELAGLGGSQTLEAPQDEVLARLLPTSSRDPEQAAQLRRLSEGSLRESKIADLRTARMLLESTPVHLTEDQAPLFGRALNDVRLTLATRLDIRSEEDAEKVHHAAVSSGAKDTETFMAEIYTFITWLQETLFTAMVELLPDEDEAPE
ncbi:DUF2017 family protein [Nesterenkonia suensis]